jgi:hypothetical protein
MVNIARLRTALAGVVWTAVMLAAVPGCSATPPPGTDGDLAGGWATLKDPVPYEPKVGSCIARKERSGTDTASRHLDTIVPCDQPHDVQVVGGGKFEGDATPAAIAALDAQCDKLADSFLKEDWRNGRLNMTVVRAASAAQPGGARWWECALSAYTIDVRGGSLTSENFTMLDADLAPGIPDSMRHGCQHASLMGGVVNEIYPVDCKVPHQAEYAGSVVMPVGTAYPVTEKQWDVLHNACNDVVARFVGVSPSSGLYFYSDPMRKGADWSRHRDVRCYAFFGTKTMIGSAKGTGGKGVPW